MLQRGRKSTFQVTTVRDRPSSAYDLPVTSREQPQPPDHLTAETRAWWSAVVAAHQLEPYQLRMLTVAAEAFDRKEQAREILARDGLSYADESGVIRARPEVAIERDSRVAFLRAVRELGLGKVELTGGRPGAFGWGVEMTTPETSIEPQSSVTPEALRLFRRLCVIEASGNDRRWEPGGARAEFLRLRLALHHALSRRPWEVFVTDVDDDPPPESVTRAGFRLRDWHEAVALRRQLLAMIRVGNVDDHASSVDCRAD